ncbi:hypothetical protein [Mesorhizobium sp. B2-3-11]|uniref:hypothetical protein n=1 Tax=Mesorhizobium sp. B2-3-11 TaxID=2589953 RepID=UPI0015E3AC57|nr:hypothetical protein [Mesorhizobium sp. B2-3-11]
MVIRYTVNAKCRVMTRTAFRPDQRTQAERTGNGRNRVSRQSESRDRSPCKREATANRSKSTSGDTFETFARDYIAQHESDWKNEKHRQQWETRSPKTFTPRA